MTNIDPYFTYALERAEVLGTDEGSDAGSFAGGSLFFRSPADAMVCMDKADDEDWEDLYGCTMEPLSGEWADGRTPQGLLDDCGVAGMEYADEDVHEICEAYESAFVCAYRAAVLRAAGRAVARYRGDVPA